MSFFNHSLRRIGQVRFWPVVPVALVGLGLSAVLGRLASPIFLVLLLVLAGGIVLLQRPVRGLFFLVVAALVVRFDIGTGTEVTLNLATLMMPTLICVWLLDMVRRRDLRLNPSCINRPLSLFLLSALLSLLIGLVLWDPAVPRSSGLTVVQLSQWALFVFSACALWLTGSLVRDEIVLRHLTLFYLAVAGSLAILYVLPGGSTLVERRVMTFAITRAPFWLLLTALSVGQLLFNNDLSVRWRWFLVVVVIAVLYYGFVLDRKTLSHWVSEAAVIGTLVWLRWPRLRWTFVGLGLFSLVILFPIFYQFAGGDAEWEESGGSRLALSGRVIEVSMRNPITGIGPAAYRAYARMKPLAYERALWVDPRVNSHNNYVDLFSQLGLLGLGIFFWFSIEVFRLGSRLRTRFSKGFAAGYVNAMLAAGASALVVMVLADWILPFVYNVGFAGFQASVLLWLFMGGLVVLDQLKP